MNTRIHRHKGRMCHLIFKSLYVISRDFPLFNLPGLRSFRNWIYEWSFGVKGINVDYRPRIQPLHSSNIASIVIGEALHLGADTMIDYTGGVEIGARVTISDCARVYTHAHPIDGEVQDWRVEKEACSKLVISDDAWIATGGIVLESVNYIGAGAVIAAGSVVTRDVPDGALVAGNPTELIRFRPYLNKR